MSKLEEIAIKELQKLGDSEYLTIKDSTASLSINEHHFTVDGIEYVLDGELNYRVIHLNDTPPEIDLEEVGFFEGDIIEYTKEEETGYLELLVNV